MMRHSTRIGLAFVTLVLIPFAYQLPAPRVPAAPLPAHAASRLPAAPSASLPVTTALSTTVFMPLAMAVNNPAYTQPFGIAMYGGIDAANGVTQMQTAGATRAMTDLRWSSVEPTQGGGYFWSQYDTRLKNAAAAGMSIHLIFDENPAWASSHRNGPVTSTFALNLQNVVSATAQRYNGSNGLPRIDVWTFYGEPDNIAAWGYQGADYADLLTKLVPIVRAANPAARVVLGGLAYDCFIGDLQDPCTTKHWYREFLPDTLNRLNTYPGGAAAYIDAVAFNYYPISLWRWPTIKDKAQSVRAVLTQSGAGQLALMVTEMSMWSMTNNVETQPQQAAWLVQSYARGLSAGIRQMYWFQVFDAQPVGPASALGLFRGTNLADPKQAYTAYGVLTRQLGGRSFNRTLNVPNAEGYVFGAGTFQKTLVWGLQPSAATPVPFALTCARRVDLLGATTQILDGGPGDMDGAFNGAIRLNVDFGKPIYVGSC